MPDANPEPVKADECFTWVCPACFGHYPCEHVRPVVYAQSNAVLRQRSAAEIAKLRHHPFFRKVKQP